MKQDYPIIITGASGMLGQACAEVFPKSFPIIWVSGSKDISYIEKLSSMWKTHKCDLSALDNCIKLFTQPSSLLIHAAAMTDLAMCEENFDFAYQNNVTVTKNIISCFKNDKRNSKLIYISTDAVYEDTETICQKKENLVPYPETNYGISKLWSEHLIVKEIKNHLILRTTILGTGGGHFCDWIYKSCQEKKEIELYDNVFFSPISTNYLANFLVSDFAKNTNGTFNFSSTDYCSRYEFALEFMNKLNITTNYKKQSFDASRQKWIKRSKNQSLSTSKIEQILNKNQPSWRDTVEDLARTYRNKII